MSKSLSKSRFVEMFGECKDIRKIGDVISISRGASPRPISAFLTNDPDGVNWIKIGDVPEDSLYITSTAEKITKEGAAKSRLVKKGDFILSNSMSFGRPYILGIDGCVHDGWLILSDFSKCFNEIFLYHALRSDDIQRQFSGKVNGATVKNLNSELVKETTIIVPPIKEQIKYSEFVKQLDKSKFILQKMIEKLELLKKSRFIELFGNDNFPKEKLKNNVEEMFIGPFGSSLKNECFVDKDKSYCMVYEQKHAIQKTIDVETRYVDEKKYNELKRFTVKSGDIIVSCRGTIGEIYAIPEGAPFGIMHPSIMKIRLNKEIYNEHFFLFFLKEYMEKAKNLALGSSVKMAIKATDLGEELFPVPSLSEQNLFVKFVNQIDKSKLILQKQLDDLVGETK